MRNASKRLFRVGPFFLPFLTLGLLLAACTGYSTPLPSETPTSTGTRRPTESPPQASNQNQVDPPAETTPPTEQPEPPLAESNEEPADPPLRMGDEQEVGDAGFSFRPVIGYDVKLLPGQATLVSEDGGIVLSLSGGNVPGADALEGVLDRLLANISEDFENFEASDPYPIVIDEANGLATDVRAELIGRPVAGRVAAVAPTDSQLFYAFVFTIQEPDGRWESEGAEVFEAVIESIQFYEIIEE